eukprot:sb/3469893/
MRCGNGCRKWVNWRPDFLKDRKISLLQLTNGVRLILQGTKISTVAEVIDLSTRSVSGLRNDIASIPVQANNLLTDCEIDEALLCKRKSNRGRQQGNWVVGLIERSTGTVRFRAVENRDKWTLLNFVRDNVKSGSSIFSDEWGGYVKLKEHEYIHRTVSVLLGEVKNQFEERGGMTSSTTDPVSPSVYVSVGGRTLVLTDSLSKFKADSISKNGLFIYS